MISWFVFERVKSALGGTRSGAPETAPAEKSAAEARDIENPIPPGEPPPPTAKVCINYEGGHRTTSTMLLTGLDIDTVGELPDRRSDAGFLQKPIDPDRLLSLARLYCS